AIENVRLFNEAQERTHELSEALEHQTATAKVLSVISGSPGELEPVFQAVLDNATRSCNAKFATLWRFEDGTARIISTLGLPSALAEFHDGKLYRPGPPNAIGRVIKSRRTVHIADYRADQSYCDRDPLTVAGVELGGIRTLLAVPMLTANELVGTIIIYRQEVQYFTDKQVALLTAFANQVVIAMENVRLLNELARSVEELRALGEVIQAVNSTINLETVLTTIVAKAVQLSGTEAGTIYVFDEASQEFRLRASYGMDDLLIAAVKGR